MWQGLLLELRPPAEFSPDDGGEGGHALRRIVKARQGREFLPAMFVKSLGAPDRHFLQRLDAIGRKAGGYNRQAPYTFFRELLNGLRGIGLKPFGRAKSRLKSEQQPLCG